ncbi:bacillithiol biosynthesis cysteine-adding enzyme BshC [Nibrella saemangeumensis]|uniref:Putative cysteine ligase BshC n=1 Tax=Nibrella saemangeumensis TaxID=1084526 RepID=A0ABP8NNS4_9BACT
MDCQYLPLSATGQFSPLFLDYLNQAESLKPFYTNSPSLEAFGTQMQQKQFPPEHRATLVNALERQYQHIDKKPDFSILAQPNTFTVTTGHQLNIFTGPLYVLYKLITIVNLTKRLKWVYPEHNFVPIYWMASEDHDFAEINHFSLFGRNYTWETQQQGAVGRMNPQELKTLFGQIPEKLFLFEEAYLTHETLSDAVRYYMNELLGHEGLICLDADDADLKRLFIPVMQDELLNQTTNNLVAETSQQLESLSYQTVISPREINLFYLGDQLRERITCEHTPGGSKLYKVLHTDQQFTQDEVLALLNEHPERFSPNVVLRPVYQEMILPNLAYIGGPSEVPYWLQLKGIFDHFGISFPLLIPRNFALYVSKVSSQRIKKLDLSPEDLFQDKVSLRRRFVQQHTNKVLEYDAERQLFEQGFAEMLEKATAVDVTLEKAVAAQRVRLLNAVERLEKKLKRAEERNQSVGIGQLQAIHNELFPNGGLQERTENFLTFYLNDKTFIQQLLDAFDPLDFRMQILLQK